jgi:four helix bundle protein
MPRKSAPFEKLRVFVQAEELADAIWALVGHWDFMAKSTVGRQLVRAADSIGANIAEGSGRGTYADNRRFVRIARGSLYETRYWLRRAYRRQLLPAEQVEVLRSRIERLGPALNAYLAAIGPSAKDGSSV